MNNKKTTPLVIASVKAMEQAISGVWINPNLVRKIGVTPAYVLARIMEPAPLSLDPSVAARELGLSCVELESAKRELWDAGLIRLQSHPEKKYTADTEAVMDLLGSTAEEVA
jgi:hypothetical protein